MPNMSKTATSHKILLPMATLSGFFSCTLYPPHHTCTNASCLCSRSGKLLKKEEQRQGVLYTLDKGALPICSVHLYCHACNTNYHHDFHVQAGTHTYYDAIPDVIQVGEHQFVECQLIQLWVTSMLVSWTVGIQDDISLPLTCHHVDSRLHCHHLSSTSIDIPVTRLDTSCYTLRDAEVRFGPVL